MYIFASPIERGQDGLKPTLAYLDRAVGLYLEEHVSVDFAQDFEQGQAQQKCFSWYNLAIHTAVRVL